VSSKGKREKKEEQRSKQQGGAENWEARKIKGKRFNAHRKGPKARG
jgi:hypothetical protein